MHQSELLKTNQFIVDTVEPCNMATPSIWPPCYYNHFIPIQTETQAVIFIINHPVDMAKFLWLAGDQINRLPL